MNQQRYLLSSLLFNIILECILQWIKKQEASSMNISKEDEIYYLHMIWL